MADDDDEFDDLFSFGNTPTNASSQQRSSSPLDFGLEDDGEDTPKSTPKEVRTVDDDDDIFGEAPTPKSRTATSSEATPTQGGGRRSDSFMDVLDGPSVAKQDEEDEGGAVMVESPPSDTAGGGDAVVGRRPRLPTRDDDDFHKHDAGTRDFLEWLDNDGTGGDTGTDRDKAPPTGESTSEILIIEEEKSFHTSPKNKTPAKTPQRDRLESTDSFDFEAEILGEVSLVSEEELPPSDVPKPQQSVTAGRKEGKTKMKREEGGLLAAMRRPKLVNRGKSAPASITSLSDLDAFVDGSVAREKGSTPRKESKEGENVPTPKAATGGAGIKTAPLSGGDSSDGAASAPTRATTVTSAIVGPGENDRSPSFEEISESGLPDDDDLEQSIDVGTSGEGAQKLGVDPWSSPSSPPPTFQHLSEAIVSPLSSVDQIRTLCRKESYVLNDSERKHLWCKVVCGKPLSDVLGSSCADSFEEWDAEFDDTRGEEGIMGVWIREEAESLAIRIVEGLSRKKEAGTVSEAGAESGEDNKDEESDERKEEDGSLPEGRGDDDEAKKDEERKNTDLAEACRSLCSVLLFHYHSSGSGPKPDNADKSPTTSIEWDPLLPPVASTLLSSGLPTVAASVVLANIMPVSMPLMALSNAERWNAAKALHSKFYLLACYHLPLLVLHLDRNATGWHWPRRLPTKRISKQEINGGAVETPQAGGGGEKVRDSNNEDGTAANDGAAADGDDGDEDNDNATHRGRNLDSFGVVPPSWFLSHLAGECGDSTPASFLEMKKLVRLWDVLLTSGDGSLPFFLALAVLETHSDGLLMMRGDELSAELGNIMSFKESSVEEEDFIGGEEMSDGNSGKDETAAKSVRVWIHRAKSLSDSTPRSVIDKLRKAEDEAVNAALVERQRVAEEKLASRLEAEAKAHKEAMEAQRLEREMDAWKALTRARLVGYYKKWNPEKVPRVDKILEIYDGRLEVLDRKLKVKYGVGFYPPAPPWVAGAEKGGGMRLSANAGKLLSTMNQGLHIQKQRIVHSAVRRGVAARNAKRLSMEDAEASALSHRVAVRVAANEILPILCASKAKGGGQGDELIRGRYSSTSDGSSPLKYYLVDSRPDETASEQGRFPTAASLSPEALLDPDRIQHHVDMFESLRGAVHICVMGEGFSSFPTLYDQPLSPEELELSESDESRTSNCALFFIKRGFPFVSILDGGFAAAHAWLARDGPFFGLNRSTILVDYDEHFSLFALLENAYREQQELATASTREKTARAMQKLLDSSMTTLTMSKVRIERLADAEGRQRVRESMSKLFSKQQQQGEDGGADNEAVGTTSDGAKKEEEAKMEDVGNIAAAGGGESIQQRFRNPLASFRKTMAEKNGGGTAAPQKSSNHGGTLVGARKEGGEMMKKDPYAPSAFAETSSTAAPVRNPFARFGRQQNAASVGDSRRADGNEQQQPQLQPFARFRSNNAAVADASAVEKKDHLQPFARFRNNTDASLATEMEKELANDRPNQGMGLGNAFKMNRFAGFGSQVAASSEDKPAPQTPPGSPMRNPRVGALAKNVFAGMGSSRVATASGEQKDGDATGAANRGNNPERGLGGMLKGFGGIGANIGGGGAAAKKQSEEKKVDEADGAGLSGAFRGFRGTIASLPQATGPSTAEQIESEAGLAGRFRGTFASLTPSGSSISESYSASEEAVVFNASGSATTGDHAQEGNSKVDAVQGVPINQMREQVRTGSGSESQLSTDDTTKVDASMVEVSSGMETPDAASQQQQQQIDLFAVPLEAEPSYDPLKELFNIGSVSEFDDEEGASEPLRNAEPLAAADDATSLSATEAEPTTTTAES